MMENFALTGKAKTVFQVIKLLAQAEQARVSAVAAGRK